MMLFAILEFIYHIKIKLFYSVVIGSFLKYSSEKKHFLFEIQSLNKDEIKNRKAT